MPNRTTVELEPARPGLTRCSKSGHVREPAKQLWLDAWADPVAGVNAFSSCITTCNLCGDGDWRLVIADAADKKLKVGGFEYNCSCETWKAPSVPEPCCSAATAITVIGITHLLLLLHL